MIKDCRKYYLVAKAGYRYLTYRDEQVLNFPFYLFYFNERIVIL